MTDRNFYEPLPAQGACNATRQWIERRTSSYDATCPVCRKPAYFHRSEGQLMEWRHVDGTWHEIYLPPRAIPEDLR